MAGIDQLLPIYPDGLCRNNRIGVIFAAARDRPGQAETDGVAADGADVLDKAVTAIASRRMQTVREVDDMAEPPTPGAKQRPLKDIPVRPRALDRLGHRY